MKTKDNELTSNGKKQAEAIMQTGLQLLPLIMNNIPQAVFWKDRDLVYLGCNQAFADDAGFSSPQEIIGKTDFEMPWKDQAELYRADDWQVMEKGEPKLNYEEPQTAPDGSTIWLRTSKIPVQENGQIAAVLGMYEDVTARKQVEKAVQESEERFRRFTEATNEGLVFHEHGKIVDANPAALAMFGHTDNTEFIGKSLLEFLMPESHEIVLKQMQLETVQPYEVQCIHKDGNAFSVETSTSTYKVDDRIIRATSIRDITERKQAEQALRDSEARYSAVVTQAQDGIVIIQDNILKFVNRAMADMVGSTQAELENTPIIDYIAPESKALIVNRIKARLAGQEVPSVYEAKLQRKDGTIFAAELSAGVIEYRGKPADVGMIRDITGRKKTDDAIRESEERFRRFTEATVEGLVFHEQGKIVDVNPAAVAIFGLTNVVDLIGRNLMEFIVPEFHQLVLKQMQLESVLPYEIQGIRKDGSTVWIETSTRTYQDGNRTIRASSIHDITQRKQLEADKLREMNVSDAIINSLPGIFYMFDAQGKLIRRNKNYETVAGYSADETATRNALDAIAEEDRERAAQAIQKAFIEGKTELEVLFKTRHAEKIPYFMTAVRMSVGDKMYVVGTGLDLSVRKQLEAQVQQAFERRGYQVQISTEISQEVAAASKLSDLFDRVVTLTKEHLGYYHTQLLRYDAAQDAVVLINGYGETGQKMLAEGHQMPMGTGLIGTAAASGTTVLRSTLAEDPDWHPNPLLPDTQGEIAVPIKWQDTVLGVLDVQSNQAGALAEDDRILLEGLCGQIAIAMHSAELVEAVRQNEARLAEALRTARLANWEYDVEKDIFTFNDQFYSIFHTTAEKAGGYQLSSARYAELFVYPDDMELVGTEIGKALSSTERVYNTTIDHRILYADGGIGYITVKLTVERGEDGKITRYYGANQDITERKQAEARLAEAFKTARLANWEYDVEKDIFTFNDQFYSIFHTTAEKAGGYQLSSARYAELFVYPDDMELVGTEIGKALSSTERVYNTTIDHRILYADGGIGYITVKLTVERGEDGKITRYYGANQDITERKQAEEALRHSEQEMAERLEELNRLYRNMSREGWQTYRETADLPSGFVFDQANIRPVDEEILADELFANIPMRVLGGEVVGTLTVANDPQHPTSPEDFAFLQQVSDQIALALESARLFDQTQSALAQSEKLFQASSQLTQAADLQELVEVAAKTMNVPVVNRAVLDIFNYNAAGDLESMDVAATWWNGTGHEPTPVGTHYSIETLRVMSLFLSPTPVFFSDAFNDERFDQSALQVAKSLSLRSGALLPLHGRTRQVGILFMEAEEPHTFTREEVRLFEALAPQITTVLENRRQFERAQKQAEREGMLNIISQKIQSATTVEAVLQIAARELGHALGAPMTIAQLSMKDKK